MIKDNPAQPVEGMRLIVPFWGLEEVVTKVVSNGNHHNVFITADQSTPNIGAPSVGGSFYAVLYYTERVMYLVKNGNYVADPEGPYISSGGSYVPYTSGTMQRYRYENGELHLYKQRYSGSAVYWQDIATVVKYVSSPTPFYVPLNSGGSANTKYVGVKLSTRDPKSTNRGYLATAALLDTQIDYGSRICITQ